MCLGEVGEAGQTLDHPVDCVVVDVVQPPDLGLCLFPVGGQDLSVSAKLGHHLLHSSLLVTNNLLQLGNFVRLGVAVNHLLLLTPDYLLIVSYKFGHQGLDIGDLLRQTWHIGVHPTQLVAGGTGSPLLKLIEDILKDRGYIKLLNQSGQPWIGLGKYSSWKVHFYHRKHKVFKIQYTLT